jgi:hypothetical protein
MLHHRLFIYILFHGSGLHFGDQNIDQKVPGPEKHYPGTKVLNFFRMCHSRLVPRSLDYMYVWSFVVWTHNLESYHMSLC